MFFFSLRIKIFVTTAILLLLPVYSPANSTDEPIHDIPSGIFGYLETVGNKVIPFNWQVKRQDGNLLITVTEEGKIFFNLCTDNGETLKWRIQVDGKHDLTAERRENTLHIQGTRFGNEYDDTVEIDERPWYQPLSFSLGSFLNSEKEDISFWVIRADKIEVIALTAKKLGVEEIMFAGSKVPAKKIVIRAEGFYSQFWHATYWYRESDNLFLRYQSVHGLPGTDETIVELVKTPGKTSDS